MSDDSSPDRRYSPPGARDRLLRLLFEARTVAGLSQQGLADQLGRRRSFVSKYECGERRLDLVELIEIAQLLELDVSALIEDVQEG